MRSKDAGHHYLDYSVFFIRKNSKNHQKLLPLKLFYSLFRRKERQRCVKQFKKANRFKEKALEMEKGGCFTDTD